ncbi:MAG: DUF2971 domain-containing protein [Victivallaceae bacterium]|nr:DUF2971 domain-containing protein [Victivallaceae bacterium]
MKNNLMLHYTSLPAGIAIISTGIMRMIQAFYLLDDFEVVNPRDKIRDSILRYSCANRYRKFQQYILNGLNSFSEFSIYTSSFSANYDDPYMWKHYTPDSGGVALVFDFNELLKGFIYENIPDGTYDPERRIVSGSNGSFTCVSCPGIVKCQYDASIVQKYCDTMIDGWFSKPIGSMSLAEAFENENIWTLARPLLSNSIYNFIIAVKDPSYNVEAEWRWVNIRPNSIFFREYKDEKNRPYVIGKFLPTAIKEILISPHGDKDNTRRILEDLRQKYNLSYRLK